MVEGILMIMDQKIIQYFSHFLGLSGVLMVLLKQS